jgi:hypothetical protein
MKVCRLVCFGKAPIMRRGFVRETLVGPRPISPTMVVSMSQLLSNAWESDGFATQHCQRGLGVSSEADEMDQMLNLLLTELFSLEGKIGKIVLTVTTSTDHLDFALLLNEPRLHISW